MCFSGFHRQFLPSAVSSYQNTYYDEISGHAGNDTIAGLVGADTLNGGHGQNTLNGGAGNDMLIGGGGKDTLTGGTGADTFIFTKASDSTNTWSADTITDFEIGTDAIDLSGVAAGLTFIGGNAFSGIGNVEVQATINAGGDTLVRVDVDGNGSADMKIILDGVTGITALDFLL